MPVFSVFIKNLTFFRSKMKSLRALLAITAISLSTLFSYAYNVTGTVIDADSEPESYATVRIFAKNDTVRAKSFGVTNIDGIIDQQLTDAGNYILFVSSVGKKPVRIEFTVNSSKPTADLGTITMQDNAEQLGEVEVVAMRPVVVKEIDRLGYNVQADEDSKTSTVQEILRKVPLVTVEADGTIKVKGSTNFKIYKNGRPSNTFTSNAKDIFAAIPASMIKKIEVITDPGANEDAEGVGAILNIVTVDNTSMVGVMGNVRAGMMTNNDVPAGGVWLTGNIGKVALSANVGYMHQDHRMGKNDTETDLTYVESGNRLFSRTSGDTGANMLFFGIDGSYELDSLNLFTIEFGGFGYNAHSTSNGFTQMFNPDGSTQYSYNSLTRTPKNKFMDFNGNFNYQHSTRRPGELLTFSYAISNNHNNSESDSRYSDTYNFPVPYSAILSNNKQNFLEQTFQADWTHPINDHNKFSTGAKLILRDNHAISNQEYVIEPESQMQDEDFTHKTTIGALYFDYRLNYGKWNARAGLRYEYSYLSAKFTNEADKNFGSSLNDFVPNASVMFALNDNNSFKFSYASRINRPGINYLDPTVNESPTSQSFGNPRLESAYYNTLSLNYSLIKNKFSLDLTAGYDFANNTIAQYQYVKDISGNPINIATYDNVGKTRSFSLSAFAQWSITSKTSAMLNASVSYNKYAIPTSNLSNHRWGANIFFRATQQLPWKLRLEGMMFYTPGNLSDVYSYSSQNSHAIFHAFSLQRSFLKEDRLTVKLQIRNPFNDTMEWRSYQNRGDRQGVVISKQHGARVFGVEISYRFGSVKTMVKKTSTSIINDDLQGGSSAASQGSSSMGDM